VIKLTVHDSVEAALQKAFPKPAAAAKRALAKYISVVESMLFDALQRGQTPEQRKLGLYAISLDQLANKGGQIGPKKIRVHKWLRDNNLELLETVVPGSKFTGLNSQVKVSPLVTLHNSLTVVAGSLAVATTDEQMDAYLAGDPVSNNALFHHLYPEYGQQWREDKLAELFDWVPVDVESLKAYVVWLETQSQLIKDAKKDTALRQSLTILGVAAVTRGYYLQRRKASPFGRMYYEGTSVQNVNKELRRAMLGNCWEYDIRSSVIAWKMGYARSFLNETGLDIDLRKSFSATLLYLEDKADFMATVRYFVFTETSPVPKDLQPKLLKRAFTAISFGARQQAKGWLDTSGNWNNPALVEILQNKDDRERFLAEKTVQLFIKEQNALDDYLYNHFKQLRPDLLKESYLQTASGRPSKAKVLAYLYQHGETQVMDIFRRAVLASGHKPLANVHDAIFFKRRLGVDLKSEVEWQMREQTGNPYWHLSASKLERYTPRSLNAESDEAAHKARIAQEEVLAKGYVGLLTRQILAPK
jgi:hypothetical protein